jgi:hypothetical protein
MQILKGHFKETTVRRPPPVQAKQSRSIYWHVPAREHTTRPRIDSTNHVRNIQETALPGDDVPTSTTSTQTTTRTSKESMTTRAAQAEEQATSSQNHATHQPGGHTQIPAQASVEAIAEQALLALPVGEEFATPATQQELAPEEIDSLIDPQLRTMDEPFPPTQVSGDNYHEPSLYPLDNVEGELAMQNADIWLSNVFDGEDGEWMPDVADAESSPLTSVPSEPPTATG